MTDRDAVRRFFRTYAATAVGPTPPQPNIPREDDEDDSTPTVDLEVETKPATAWKPKVVGEMPAREGEFPTRFIDGSQTGHPVVCVHSPQGWPIPMFLSEVGAVAMRSDGRHFTREFVAVERVLAFVADPFPWEEIESFASALASVPEFVIRVVPANRTDPDEHSPFDYEANRTQAWSRAVQEMRNLERIALAASDRPTLVDGPLNRVTGDPPKGVALRVGVAKSQAAGYLHDEGWRTVLNLGPGQRSPVFKVAGRNADRPTVFPVATWFLKLATGPRLAPNWGYVRVEVPWSQFERDFDADFGFVDRLSRWLIDARCRADSYARMPVSLDPIVRAEDGLKPLFTPFPVLANRLYRAAGLFRRDEV